jgi:glycosyltransferase involved in cell wall biosynthesis
LRIIARLNIGGPAIQAVSLSSELPETSYQTVLVCGTVGAWEGDMSYFAVARGVRPHLVPSLGREISILDDVRTFFALRRIIKRFRPHIVHTHTAKAGTLGRAAALSVNMFLAPGKRIRLVHTFHGHVFHGYFGSLKTSFFIQIERALARFTDRIIVVSSLQRKDICHRFKIASENRVKLIRLGFDLSNFRNCERFRSIVREKYLSGPSSDVFLVGMVGRLTPVKNPALFLRAAKCLKDRGKIGLFRFLIVGDGELKKNLMQEAADLGIADNVSFAGWQREMPHVYGGIDAVALSSRNEGTPVALIEAMAAAKPVAATDVGGVRDLLGDIVDATPTRFSIAQNGLLVSNQDGESLADALLFLQQNRASALQMARRAQDFVFRQYSMERLLEDIKWLYDELMRDN